MKRSEIHLSVIGDGLDILKLVNKGANADLYSKIGKLIDEARDLYQQREELERENKDLKQQLRFKGEVQRVGSFVYQIGDEYPLCSRCADVDNRPVHLVVQRIPQQGDVAVCPQCKNQQRRFLRRAQVEQMIKDGGSV